VTALPSPRQSHCCPYRARGGGAHRAPLHGCMPSRCARALYGIRVLARRLACPRVCLCTCLQSVMLCLYQCPHITVGTDAHTHCHAPYTELPTSSLHRRAYVTVPTSSCPHHRTYITVPPSPCLHLRTYITVLCHRAWRLRHSTAASRRTLCRAAGRRRSRLSSLALRRARSLGEYSLVHAAGHSTRVAPATLHLRCGRRTHLRVFGVACPCVCVSVCLVSVCVAPALHRINGACNLPSCQVVCESGSDVCGGVVCTGSGCP
jgi:hypothetical protein